MNYRHAFHAGNFADVFKHAVLVALLEAMKQKDAPFSYFDSHAGAGRYDLAGAEATKTGEHRDGIARLLDATRLPGTLHTYLNIVRSLSPGQVGAISAYPGSPLIAALLTRTDDRLVLCEMQESETASLRQLFQGDKRVSIHRRDGYQALRALLPPTPRRGLALIDPPFESQSLEFEAITDALEGAFSRWKTGTYAVWYPIKLAQQVAPFLRFLRKAGMTRVLVAELLVHPANSALRLNGCGMAIVNAPYQFDRTLNEMMPVLLKVLAQGPFGSRRVEWLVEG